MSRQELYRFIYSFSIFKYIPILSSVLLVLCYMNIFVTECKDEAVCVAWAWGELGTCFTYIVLMIITVVSVYIGREFKNKTLNYEIMRGMSTFRISLTKMISCGVFIPIIVGVCLLVYLSVFHAITNKQDVLRLFLIMLVISHIASVVLMLILICKNAVVGAIIAFLKFAFVETIFIEVVKNIVSQNVLQIMNKMCVYIQVMNITDYNTGTSLVEMAFYVVISFVIEYLLLQCIYYVSANYLIDPGV